jgi:hypothetical protein
MLKRRKAKMNKKMTVSFNRKYPCGPRYAEVVGISVTEEFDVILPDEDLDLKIELAKVNDRLAKDPKDEKFLAKKAELENLVKEEKSERGKIYLTEVDKAFTRVKSMIIIQEENMKKEGIIVEGTNKNGE